MLLCLFSNLSLALEDNFIELRQLNAQKQNMIIDREYTTTTFEYPKLCTLDEYKKSCRSFLNYYVSKYEHSYISYLSEHQNFEDDEDFNFKKEKAYQHIKLDYRVISKFNFATIIADVEQHFKGQSATYMEVFNFAIDTNKLIHFKELFDDPALASMICKNHIYSAYKDAKIKNFPLILAQIEVNPKNFLLRPNGVEFVFSQNQIKDRKFALSLLIKLDDLMMAKPKKEWFPSLSAN